MARISVIIPTLNEAGNIGKLVARIKNIVSLVTQEYEIIVVDGHSSDATIKNAQKSGARSIIQKSKGFGGALKDGFATARGEYIITIDGDLSHNPDVITVMWKHRNDADILVGSRYIKGGSAKQSLTRKILSRTLNTTFSTLLSIPVRDMSSNLRMYRRTVIDTIDIQCTKFDVLQEILVRACAQGFTIKEVPMHYEPREYGVSKAKIASFTKAYLETFLKLFALRNSIKSADYDARAYFSLNPLQRYWQQKRHRIIMKFLGEQKKGAILDLGCGTSLIIQQLPHAVATDVLFNKLRFLKRTNSKRILSSTFAIPCKGRVFDAIISSQVIEHIPSKKELFIEFKRVLRPGGTLILGTPDYDKAAWNAIEWIYKKFPTTYGHEHITHYTQKSLAALLEQFGFTIQNIEYICDGEMIIKAQKNG